MPSSDKVDDYFTRCQLAAYDARAAEPLSRSIEDYQQLAAQNLSAQSVEVASFPLATMEANKPLPLACGHQSGLAEQGGTPCVSSVIAPLLGNKDSLGAAEWAALCAKFAAFEAWQARKPATSVEQLGIARIREVSGGQTQGGDR